MELEILKMLLGHGIKLLAEKAGWNAELPTWALILLMIATITTFVLTKVLSKRKNSSQTNKLERSPPAAIHLTLSNVKKDLTWMRYKTEKSTLDVKIVAQENKIKNLEDLFGTIFEVKKVWDPKVKKQQKNIQKKRSKH